MTVPFSRIQLAKALLEYDNDPSNPHAPNRSAQESAIFAPLRRNAESRPSVSSRRSDYLGVSAVGGQSFSLADNRHSRVSGVSINTLQNPFRADDHLEEEVQDEEDIPEVDLSSWGLDAFIPRDKASRNGKGKAKSTDLVSPHSVSTVSAHQPFASRDASVTAPRRALGASRSMSVGGNLEYFGTDDGDQLASLRMDDRRRSIGSALDKPSTELPMQRRRASSYTPLSNSLASHPQPVPFPTASIRSVSPNLKEDVGLQSSSFARRLNFTPAPRESILSLSSMDSKMLLKDEEPPLDYRQRTVSNTTKATPADDNPFAVRPPSPSRGSRFDPKSIAHARTVSNASMGSRMLRDNDGLSVRTAQVPDERERRYSTTMDLLRPKVLVMPSPLQPTKPSIPLPNEKVRNGFQLSTDGPPLPPGARSARRASAMLELPPIASNSFTPNAVAGLSLSQLTFRNTLRIGGQRDSYMEGGLPMATQDGEQAVLDTEPDEPQISITPDPEDDFKTTRPPGKLYGKSLIDDLENRKAQMRSKQRVFTGDERPSMMARGSQHRSSTLIDPAALQSRPVSQHMPSFGSQGSQQALGRRNSANIKPLLNFDEDDKIPTSKSPGARLPNGRSVFGVDTLWEREMVKLREIEAKEKADAEEQRKREEEEEEVGSKQKKKKHKRKHKGKDSLTPDVGSLAPQTDPQPRVSVEPPILPDIHRAHRRPPPQVPDDESESGQSDDAGPSGMQTAQPADVNWHADSSDEEQDVAGPRRTTGTGPRFPIKHVPHRINDSDDDLPLSVAVTRVGLQPSHSRPGNGDSDDERPLSTLLQKQQSNIPPVNFDNLLASNDDDDDRPLGLRVSRLAPSLHTNGDDDDRPLAYHPEQQRRTQYQMMAQQQQQLLMQAQMHNSMYFSPPSMMGSQFFGPTMMPMMMQPPMSIPSPPPMQDEAKFGRVDKWRRDVAVEGEV